MARPLTAYLAQDRLRAVAHGETLPDRATGSALFADLSGFTALTEQLTQQFGARRGIEELTRRINAVYEVLIRVVEQYGGSVINFAGDAITCWFDAGAGAASLRASAAALALQTAMRVFSDLSLKVAVTSGDARRFVVGDGQIQFLDTLAGQTIARLAAAEHLTRQGEVLADAATVARCGDLVQTGEWRVNTETQERFARILSSSAAVEPVSAPPVSDEIPLDTLRAWVPPTVFAREASGLGEFLTELRPAVALFMRFGGIDYDSDESAGQKLDTLIQRVQRLVMRYDGTLLQLTIGDKGSYVYVCFGAPTAHEDDARRAVRAALALREIPSELTFLPPVQIGLSRGTLRVGASGGPTRQTFGALGDEVNLAARLMQAASAGEILVSGHVQQAIEAYFVFEPRAPIALKGKAEPLPVFAVTGERQPRATRLLEPTYRLPMIGRQAELAVIANKLELARQGQGQLIGLTAEAGMGKSRLVAEAIRLAHRQGFAAFGGACESSGQNTAYLVWKAIWQAFFDVDPTASVRRQLHHLEGEIQDRAPHRLPALPLLAPILEVPIDDNDFTRTLEPKDRRNVLVALFEDCLKAAAQEEPLLFVLEDVHWIDPLSHDLLESLARATANSAVCFVLAYRPVELESLQAPRVEALPNFTRIALNELTSSEAEQLIRAKLAQLYPERSNRLPRKLVEHLTAKAQGNPFFIEELLNYLHDRGISPYDEPALTSLELPSSLHTLILSRVDQLSETQKATLKVASIIGRLFPFAWLHGYYSTLGAPEVVKADLDVTARLDITPLITPEPELAYLFKHIVTQEVTYESLAYAIRAELHELLAQYLEARDADKYLDLLAFHYGRSENVAKQREYFRKAGEAAQSVSAYSTAVDYFARLLELTPKTDPVHSALALKLADAHASLGDYSAARAAIQQAQAAATTDTDRASALAALGDITCNGLGDYASAQTILIEAVQLARASGNARTLCRALSALGTVNYLLGKLDEAQVMLNESLSLARTLDVNREMVTLNRLGVLAGQRDDWDEAKRLYTEVHTRAKTVGNRYMAMLALNNLGWVAGNCKDIVAAREYTQQALALAREIGAQDVVAVGCSNLAECDTKLGQLAAAHAGLREGLAVALRLGALQRMVQTVDKFALLAHAEGQTERALALLGLARRQPAWDSLEQRDVDSMLAQWALDPAVVGAGLAKGAALDWDATIEVLLKE